MSDEVFFALNRERAWRNISASMERGSYCENSSPEYQSAMAIVRLYADLSEALLKHERGGHKFPKEPTP